LCWKQASKQQQQQKQHERTIFSFTSLVPACLQKKNLSLKFPREIYGVKY